MSFWDLYSADIQVLGGYIIQTFREERVISKRLLEHTVQVLKLTEFVQEVFIARRAKPSMLNDTQTQIAMKLFISDV